MDGQTYRCTDFPCILQDFIPFGAAALLTWNIFMVTKLRRARAPKTIFCLWATGLSILRTFLGYLDPQSCYNDIWDMTSCKTVLTQFTKKKFQEKIMMMGKNCMNKSLFLIWLCVIYGIMHSPSSLCSLIHILTISVIFNIDITIGICSYYYW